MVTPCHRCGASLYVPSNIPAATFHTLYCECGHSQRVIGRGSMLEPTQVLAKEASPWSPHQFPSQ
jgi:hypothetical protein